MEQQYPPSPPTPETPAPPSKKWRVQETITVVFLVLCPIIGWILMWVIANWSKKIKIIVTIITIPYVLLFLWFLLFMIGTLTSMGLVSKSGGVRVAVRDARREVDVREIFNAQRRYYNENGVYYTSVNYPSSIGDYMPKTPTDPKTDAPYGWIDNTGNDQKYCAYADLERDGFYVASQKGNGEVETEPRTLSDCEKLLK